LDHDVAALRHIDEVLDLATHDFSTADWTVQHAFVRHDPEQRGLVTIQNGLPIEPSRYELFHLVVCDTNARAEQGPGIVSRLKQTRNEYEFEGTQGCCFGFVLGEGAEPGGERGGAQVFVEAGEGAGGS
jgi:hypothetical protein